MRAGQVLQRSIVAFHTSQRAVYITAPGCLGTCHSLLSLITMCSGVLHCRVSSSLECGPTPRSGHKPARDVSWEEVWRP